MATFFTATSDFTVDQGSITVSQYDDSAIAIGVSDLLTEGEDLSAETVTAHLTLLPEIGSADAESDASDLLVDTPDIQGSVIIQQVSGLAADRVYRLLITFGPANNTKTREVFIRCIA